MRLSWSTALTVVATLTGSLLLAVGLLPTAVEERGKLRPCKSMLVQNIWPLNCQGTYTYANGDEYVGEFKGTKPNGQGTTTSANGGKYVGQFSDGKPNGRGTIVYANGDKYVGELKDGKVHGQGSATYANGNRYVGEYKYGLINKGHFVYANGEQLEIDKEVVELEKSGGVYVVPVRVNDVITLPFIVDSGATDVTISADVVETLKLAGALSEADFLEQQTLELADGSSHAVRAFMLRSLKVGNKTMENIHGSVAPGKGSLLLGQSFLKKFKSIAVDNERQTLLLSE